MAPPTSAATVVVPSAGADLAGALTYPPRAGGVVVFAHGGAGGRAGPRNRAVAEALVHAGLATLLLDLLTPGEDAAHVDAGLLGDRVVDAIDWLGAEAVVGDLPPRLHDAPVGCFGASTGAAAALIAAAQRADRVAAVVSRGGRPDLAADALGRVTAPTLLIVGGDDPDVLALNERARASLKAPSRLEVIPGAGHLFAEPGTLERVAELTRDWFVTHLDRG